MTGCEAEEKAAENKSVISEEVNALRECRLDDARSKVDEMRGDQGFDETLRMLRNGKNRAQCMLKYQHDLPMMLKKCAEHGV